jgi:hypothetical protein
MDDNTDLPDPLPWDDMWAKLRDAAMHSVKIPTTGSKYKEFVSPNLDSQTADENVTSVRKRQRDEDTREDITLLGHADEQTSLSPIPILSTNMTDSLRGLLNEVLHNHSGTFSRELRNKAAKLEPYVMAVNDIEWRKISKTGGRLRARPQSREIDKAIDEFVQFAE